MSYLRAVLNNNKTNEIKYLKHLVLYGEKLRLDTNRYEKELKKHNQPILKKQTLKKKYTSTKLNKYSINSVTTDENSIRIDFNHYVSKKDLKFFELKYKNLNKDLEEEKYCVD